MWWEAVRAASADGSAGPGGRWGHTCNAVEGGRYLYVFGGYACGGKCQTNDVHVFDAVTRTWSKPVIKGDPPSPRDSHSCTAVGSKLFVFGGTDGKKPLKDLHILDTSSNSWIQPTLYGRGPDAREGHTAVLVGARIFIFGGCGESSDTHQEVYYNDLFVLETGQLIWKHVVTSGNPPSGRGSHTCSPWKNKLVVIGGEDSSNCYLSDVHMLDMDTFAWEKINATGQMFPPRAGHTTTTLGNTAFVFGGFRDDRNLYNDLHILNLESWAWSEVTPVNRGPSARFSVAGDCLDVQKGILVLIGGCDESLEALDDMYYLHTGMLVTNGLLWQRKERSIKRELKRKCLEGYVPSERYEKVNHSSKHGVSATSMHPENLQQFSQAGIKICDPKAPKSIKFDGVITNINHHGYTIETIISGKLFRGLLLSCTSVPCQDSAVSSNGVAAETGNIQRYLYQATCINKTSLQLGATSLNQEPKMAFMYSGPSLAPHRCQKKKVAQIPDEKASPSATGAEHSAANQALEIESQNCTTNRPTGEG